MQSNCAEHISFCAKSVAVMGNLSLKLEHHVKVLPEVPRLENITSVCLSQSEFPKIWIELSCIFYAMQKHPMLFSVICQNIFEFLHQSHSSFHDIIQYLEVGGKNTLFSSAVQFSNYQSYRRAGLRCFGLLTLLSRPQVKYIHLSERMILPGSLIVSDRYILKNLTFVVRNQSYAYVTTLVKFFTWPE